MPKKGETKQHVVQRMVPVEVDGRRVMLNNTNVDRLWPKLSKSVQERLLADSDSHTKPAVVELFKAGPVTPADAKSTT